MSERLDRVLAALDGTGQHSYEGGHGHDPGGWCARCQASEPAEGGDLCAGCRAYLLGDTDVDPRRPWVDHGGIVLTGMDRLRVQLAPSPEETVRNGAVGDGITDDTTAIQAAITATFRADGRVVHHINGDYRDNRPENLALVRPHWQPAVEDAEAAMDRLRSAWPEPNDTQLDRLHSLVVELGARMAVPFAAAADGLTSVINAYRERRTR